jgi:phage terminase small subunit
MASMEPKWGPKMAALPNDRWRRFVCEWLDRSQGGATGAARRAGFEGKPDTLYVTAYRLSHDSRIQEAIQEEARKRLNSMIPLSLDALQEIVSDKEHKDRLGAVKSVLDRAGLHETKQIEHKHEFIANDPVMLERVRQLADRLGLPAEKLIGRSAAAAITAPVQDAQFEEVDDGEQDRS